MSALQKSFNILLYCSVFCSLTDAYFPDLGGAASIIGYLTCIFVLFYSAKLCKFPIFLLLIDFIILLGQFVGYALTPENNYIVLLLLFFIRTSFYLCCMPRNIPNASIPEKILKSFAFIAIVSCLFAVMFQLRPDVFSFRESGYNIDNKYPSFWGHRNTFAAVLLCGIFAQIYFITIKGKDSKIQKALLYFMIGNLIVTLSRTAYVSLAAFYVLYYLMNYKQHKKEFYALLLAVIIAVVVYAKYSNLSDFVDTYMIREESGLTGRDFVWSLGLASLQGDHLIWGHGMGFTRIFLGDSDVVGTAGFHNMYLTYLVEGGIVLLSCYLLMVFYIVKKVCSNLLPKNRRLASYWLSIILAYHVYVFFEAAIPFSSDRYTAFAISSLAFCFPLMYTKIKTI